MHRQKTGRISRVPLVCVRVAIEERSVVIQLAAMSAAGFMGF
jgi:hypothetical protein